MVLKPAPQGGLCEQDPVKFTQPSTPQQIDECVSLCQQCPVLKECREWADNVITEYNQGREANGLRRRINLAGVVAGEHYIPTNSRGRPMNMDFTDLDKELDRREWTGYDSGYDEHTVQTRSKILSTRPDYLGKEHRVVRPS